MINKILKFLCLLLILIFNSENIFASDDIYEIEADKIEYNDNDKIIFANGNAIARNQFNKKVSSDKIIYYKNKNIIKTFKNSKYEDGENILYAEEFFYDLNLKKIEATNSVILIDKDKNKFNFDFFQFFENDQRGTGLNLKTYLIDDSHIRAKKSEIDNKNGITQLTDSKFTTCTELTNDNKKYCPTWSLDSKKVTHYKKEKIIVHKNAVFKIKNIPIMYTPYFSHPDPSVKRKSGFLPPSIKTISNIGRTFRAPYFWVISDDKDLTITPIYYFDEKNTFLTTYRQDFKNGFLQIENGYSEGYRRLNKNGRTGGSRNYTFLDYKELKEDYMLGESFIDAKIQRISQTNFVRANKINTELFDEDIRDLENTIKFSTYGDQKRLEVRAGIFENLDESEDTKYTYFLPDGLYSFNQNYKNFSNFNFNSYFQGRKFSNNQKQLRIRNLFNLDTRKLVAKKIGTGTNFKLNIYNKNIYNSGVQNSKNNENIDNYFTLGIDSTLPLANIKKNTYQTIIPRVFAKYSSGKQLDALSNDKVLNFSDIYSMNRTNDMDLPETGFSIGHGVEYSISKNRKRKDYLNFNTGIGQVVSLARQDKMPTKSSLDNKSSDFAGFVKFNIFGNKTKFDTEEIKKIKFLSLFSQNRANFDYKFNLSNDFNKFNRNNFSFNSIYNGFYSSIIFNEENEHIGDARSINLDLRKLVRDNYYLKFSTQKNLKNSSTQFNNFSLNFENDCISSALTYSREFYTSGEISSSKSLIFSVIIKPFSDNFAPDLTSFIE